jgi:hypothetical protein
MDEALKFLEVSRPLIKLKILENKLTMYKQTKEQSVT